MKTLRKMCSAVVILAMLVGFLPVGVQPASAATGDFNVSGGNGGTDYSYSDGVLTINTSTPLTISTSSQTSDRVAIASGATANITLAGVNIQAPANTSAIDVGSNASLTLTLANGSQNTLAVTSANDMYNNAGIHVPSNASLTIQCAAAATGGSHQCTENGNCGQLSVTGGVASDNGYGGAGIGGNGTNQSGEQSGSVSIIGGQVTIMGGTAAYAGAGIGGGTGAGAGGDCGPVYITGGQIIITGGQSSGSSTGYGGAGIGGGSGNIGDGGDGGIVVITGGNVQVTGGSSNGNSGRGGAGIGGGIGQTLFGTSGNGGDGGTVVILAPGVTVQGGTGNTANGTDIGGGTAAGGGSSGYEGQGIKPDSNGNYTVYGGNVTLPNPPDTYTIPDGATLTIPSGSTLVVPNDTTLVVEGTLDVDGSLSNSGTISGSGSLTGSGTVTNNGGTIDVDNNSFAANVSLSITSGGSSVSSATYGSTVTLTATVTSGDDQTVTSGTVDFYRGEVGDANKLNDSAISLDNNGTAALQNYQITGENWIPGETAYTIIAVYTPASGSSLLSSSGTAQLTVTKASQATPPDAPSGASNVSANSVTLNTVTSSGGYGDVQYGYTTGGGSASDINNWTTSTTFSGLSAGTDYTFYTRYAGNDYYNPSGPSSGTTIYTAHATPTGNEGYTINYANETVTAASGYEVRLTESDTWTTGSINITPGGTFQVRHAADENGSPASAATTVNVTARPDAPTLTIDNQAEGVTVPTGYFYNTTGTGNYSDSGWTQGTGNLVKVEADQTIYIYAAAVTSGDNPAFKSNVQTLTAPARGSTPSVPDIDYEDEALSGTTTDMQYRVRENGEWKDCSANMSLTSFDWDGSEKVTVYFRTKATDDNYASDPTEALTIPARPAAPAAPEVSDKTDASITITATSGVQYRLGDNGQWQTSTSGSITFDNLTAGTTYIIYARTPAVTEGANLAFASAKASTQVTTKTSAGEAPTVGNATATDTTITLPYDAAWEYSTNQSTWNSGEGANVFNGLNAATEYTYYVRVKETDDAEASNAAAVTVYTAHAAPTAENYTIDFDAETLTFDDSYEVNTAEGFDETSISSGVSLANYIGDTLYIRHTATTGGAPASEAVEISIPARPDAPSQAIDNNAEQITIAAGQEYRVDDTNEWTKVNTDTIVDVAQGTTVTVRVAATDSAFKSEEHTVTAPARATAPAVPAINFTTETIGTVAGTTYSTDDGSTWHACTADMPAAAFGWNGTNAVTVLFRTAASADNYASDAVSLTIPSRPAAPQNVRGGTNSITNVNSTMAYSVDGETWTAITGNRVTNLRAGSYLVRFQATDSAFASESVSVTVSNYVAPPSTPSEPEPSGPSTGDSDGWTSITDELDKLNPDTQEEPLTIEMNGETEVPKEVFETIAGKDVDVVFDMGDGVSWSVNGADIPADADLSNLDLGVSMNTDGIPVDVINAITGEATSVQITLAHDGDFGFALTLSAPLGEENAGYWANLYHYNEDAERMEFETAALIDDDGTANLRMTHASQYAIVIDDHPHETVLPFTDVNANDWFYDPVVWAYGQGLMTGTSATTFEPNTSTTRAMIVAILNRLEDGPTADSGTFTDVADGDWYAEAVNWAASEGIVAGFEDGTFRPNDPITREQMAAILYNYAQWKGYDVSNRADLSRYSDQPSLWANDVMQWAVAEGLISGTTATTLDPQGTATRAQVAAILERFLEN